MISPTYLLILAQLEDVSGSLLYSLAQRSLCFLKTVDSVWGEFLSCAFSEFSTAPTSSCCKATMAATSILHPNIELQLQGSQWESVKGGRETQSLWQLKRRGDWMGQGIWDELVKEGSEALRVGGMKVYQNSLTADLSVHTLQIHPMATQKACVSHVSALPPLPALYRVLAAVSSAACQHFHSVMGPCTGIRGKPLNIK